MTAIARPGVDAGRLAVGDLVGVQRSSGAVTVGRVEAPAADTPPGMLHVTLAAGGAWKHVPPELLFALPPAAGTGER